MATAEKRINPIKGAGTQFFRVKNEKEATVAPSGVLAAAEVKKDANWNRISKIKELQPGEVSADTYEDNYLDDVAAEWKSTSQGVKSAGEISLTLAWMPGDTAQQAIVADFESGKKTYWMVKYPNGARDVFYGFVSSLGKTIPQNETMTRTIKIVIVGKPSLAENNGASDE